MDDWRFGEDTFEPRGGSLQAGNDKAGKRSHVSVLCCLFLLSVSLSLSSLTTNGESTDIFLIVDTFVNFSELESTVEELRGNVINRKTRVNMSDVENMALILSKSR